MIKLLVGKGERPDYGPLFVSVAALMVIAVGILVITIQEKKEAGPKAAMSKEVKRSMIFLLANIAFAVIGVGWAAINVNSYPMIVEMSKGCDIGKFTGTYYTFSMTAQIFTPVLSGFLLENISYRTLFPYVFIFLYWHFSL